LVKIAKLVQSIVGSKGVETFDPYPWSERRNFRHVDLDPTIYELNSAASLESSLYGDSWSSNMIRAIDETKYLEEALSQASSKSFPETSLGDKLKQVSRLIETSNVRGADRDLLYVEFGGWDHHSMMKVNIDEKFTELNSALQSFWQEMEKQQNDDKVALIIASDFGRTYTPNSSSGSDHGWGGNYFMMGSDVRGGQILGKYPDLEGDYVEKRGRFIPTTSWDAIWHGIASWMGVSEEKLLDVVPGREEEIANGEFFTRSDLFFSTAPSPPPTQKLPTPSPTLPAPTPYPTLTPPSHSPTYPITPSPTVEPIVDVTPEPTPSPTPAPTPNPTLTTPTRSPTYPITPFPTVEPTVNVTPEPTKTCSLKGEYCTTHSDCCKNKCQKRKKKCKK